MAIVKRPKGTGKTAYQVRWRHALTRKWQSFTLDNARDAKQLDAAVKARRCAVLDTDPEVVSLAIIGKPVPGLGVVAESSPEGSQSLAEGLTAWAGRAGLTPSSRAAYGALVARIGELGGRPVGEVTAAEINAWFCANEHYSLSTRLTTEIGLRHVLTKANRREVMADIKFKGEREVIPNYLSDAQVAAVVTRCAELGGPTLGLAVRTAADCGTRWGETFGLSVASVVPGADPVLLIESQVTATKTDRAPGFTPTKLKSSHARRTLPIGEHLATDLLAQAAGRFPLEALLRPAEREVFSYRNFRTVWERMRQTTPGIPETLRFHDLRHSAAKRWLENGALLGDVCRALGHSSITITDREYGAFEHGRQDRIRAAMGAGFGRPTRPELSAI